MRKWWLQQSEKLGKSSKKGGEGQISDLDDDDDSTPDPSSAEDDALNIDLVRRKD